MLTKTQVRALHRLSISSKGSNLHKKYIVTERRLRILLYYELVLGTPLMGVSKLGHTEILTVCTNFGMINRV